MAASDQSIVIVAPRRVASAVRAMRVSWLIPALWIGLVLVRGLLYTALIPPWQSPDEPTSVELLLTMHRLGRTVSPADTDLDIQREITLSMRQYEFWRWGIGAYPATYAPAFAEIWGGRTQLNRPPLYHILLLPAAALTADLPIDQRLYIFHLCSLLLTAATIGATLTIGRAFDRQIPGFGLTLAALAALHPQLMIIGTSVNSDTLAALIGALVFLVLLAIMRDGLSWRRALLLIGLLLAGLFTKRTTVFLVPTACVALLPNLRAFVTHQARAHRRRLFALIGAAAVLSLIGLLLTPAIVHALNSYLFDWGAQRRWLVLIQTLIDPSRWSAAWIVPATRFLNRTFWAEAGWHRAVLPFPIQETLLYITGLGWLLSLIVLLFRRSMLLPWQRRFAWICWLGTLLCLGQTMAQAVTGLGDFPQGRYLFPALVPMLALIALGLCGLVARTWQRGVAVAALIAMLALDSYVLLVLIPRTFGLS